MLTAVGICAPAAAPAQSAVAPQTGFGRVRVAIEDQLGGPLHGVTAALVDETDGKTVATMTTTAPTFEFGAVRPGVYGVRGTKPGFAFFYVSVEVHDLETASLEAVMRVADASEVVTVIGRETAAERATRIRLDAGQSVPAKICDAGGCVTPATKVADVQPAYPATALTSGVEGSVIINGTIDAEGAVREAIVLRQTDQALGTAALEAVWRWRFTPAQLNGVPVPVAVNITVDFRLQAPPASAR